ncbi:MAG: hypothetical protein WD605_01660 [Candidatus Paceibacterota bacterium]
MKIRYATAHRWRKGVVKDPLSLFGKSEQKKLVETLGKVSDKSISYKIEPLSEDFFAWWMPMYEERIGSKDNPVFFDVKEKTLGNPDKDKKYFSLSLMEGEDRLGGLFFSIKDDTLFFAYRTLAYDWQQARLRASPSLYVEYIVAEHARDIGLKNISHGKDRNPYGLNSSIGLAMFKFSVGCKPELPKEGFEVQELDTGDLDKDVLVFECPTPVTEYSPITKVYLVADEQGQNKWSQIERFSNAWDIEIITRSAT